MRLIRPAMANRLLLTLALACTSLFLSAQLDPPDGETINTSDLEVTCNNGNTGDMEQEIDDFFNANDDYLSDTGGGCDHTITDWTIMWDDPYDPCVAGDMIEVEVEYTDCVTTNPGETAIYYIEIDDGSDPEWTTDPDVADINGAPLLCDFSGSFDQDIEDWIDDVIAGNSGVAEDDCTPAGQLVITSDWPGSFDGDGACGPHHGDMDIEFTVTDLCGMSDQVTVTVTIGDAMPPEINGGSNATITTTADCDDYGGVEAAIDNWLQTPGNVVSDCSDPADLTGLNASDGEFSWTPSLSSWDTDDLTHLGGCVYGLDFEVDWTDCTGQSSSPITITVELLDATEPETDEFLPDDGEFLGTICPGDWPDLEALWGGDTEWDATDNCMGDFTFTYDQGASDNPGDLSCGQTGEVHVDLQDDCGNNADGFPRVWTYDVGPDPSDPLRFDNMDDHPDEFEQLIVKFDLANCDGEMDPCMWLNTDADNVNEEYEWEVMVGTHILGGCGNIEIEYSHTPCGEEGAAEVPAAPNAETCTIVTIEAADQCVPQPIIWEFEICVLCAGCAGGGIYCSECDDTNVDGASCNLCDPAALDAGFESCTPPCENPSCPSGQSLCGSGVEHNMSWFAFVASNTDLELSLEDIRDCVGGCGGVQFGVWEECGDAGDCLCGEDQCSTIGTASDDCTDLIVGNTYYLWVDGCCGSQCDYTITASPLVEIQLDDGEAIVVTRECDGEVLTELDQEDLITGEEADRSPNCDQALFVVVCPEECFTIAPIHIGNIGFFEPDWDKECDTYPNESDMEFFWSGDLNDLGADDETIPADLGGEFQPELCAPRDLGNYEICLDFIVPKCRDLTIAPDICVEIRVQVPEPVRFDLEVCYEDLQSSFRPNEFDRDIDRGISFNYDDYIGSDWEEDDNDPNYRCSTFDVTGSCPACDAPQTICIDVVGDEDKTPLDWFMYSCQFYQCDINDTKPDDCDTYREYRWEWPDPIRVPFDADALCVTIEEGHEDIDSDNDNCDTIPEITVMLLDLMVVIDTLNCTDYCVDIDLDGMQDQADDQGFDFDDWPEIFSNYQITFHDCNTGNEVSGATQSSGCNNTSSEGLLELGSPQSNICIRVEYDFPDGAWWDQDGSGTSAYSETASCFSLFGPFDWGDSAPPAPLIDGDAGPLCNTDLTGHVFTVTDYGPPDVIEWRIGGGGTIVGGNIGQSITVDFDAGQSSVCVYAKVDSECGQTEEREFCVTFIDAPTVTLSPVDDICVSTAPDGDAVTTVTVSSSAMPAGGTYTYEWEDNGTGVAGGATADFGPYANPGQHCVRVRITDDIGCVSEWSDEICFEVAEPLAAPVVSCGTLDQTSVEFVWNAVPGATGYEIIVDGGTPIPVSGTDYTVPGLSLGQQVFVTVQALGGTPCFDSALTPWDCTTTECPDNGVVHTPMMYAYCTGDPANPTSVDMSLEFDLSAAAPDMTGGTGQLTFVSTPAGINADGTFEPSSLAAGTYNIVATYTFGATNECPATFPNTIVITQTPDPSFTLDDTVCETGAASITIPDPSIVTNIDYDGGTVNVDGDIEWDMPGMKTVCVDVEQNGCPASTCEDIMVNAAITAPMPVCGPASRTMVSLSWPAVTGASGYEVNYTIDGTPGPPITTTDLMVEIPGLTEGAEVIFTVTVFGDEAAGFCDQATSAPVTCTAGNCPTFGAPVITCDEELFNEITISWTQPDPMVTEYDIYVDGDSITTVSDLTYTFENLDELETLEIVIVAVHWEDDCPSTQSSPAECTTPCADTPAMSDIRCISTVTSITFEWDAVPGVTEYGVFYTLPDGTMIADTIPDLSVLIDNLLEGDEVTITVEAVNPTAGCPSDSNSLPCVANSCVNPNFVDNSEPICWDGVSPIELILPTVTRSDNGNDFPGVITFDQTVANGNEFTPTDNMVNGTYVIDFMWVEDGNPTCEHPGSVTVTVYIRPTPVIDPIDPICAGDFATISGSGIPVDAAATWDFGSGDPATETGFGPHDVVFDMTETISLTVTNDMGEFTDPCAETVTAEVVVFPELGSFGEDRCIDITADGGTFVWDPVVGADRYEVVLSDGTVIDNGTSTEYIATGGVAGTAIEITVIAYPPADSECPPVEKLLTCTPDDCPTIDDIIPEEVNCLLDEIPSFTVLASGGVPPYTYMFGSQPEVTGDPPTFQISGPGTYQLILSDTNDCSDTLSIDIPAPHTADLEIQGPTSLILGETGELEYVFNTSPTEIPTDSVIWYIVQDGERIRLDLPDQDRVEITELLIEQFGPAQLNFEVEVYFDGECFKEADYRVDIVDQDRWYIPNSITPKLGDGDKDASWKMYTVGSVFVDKVSIYDRWGELVFIKDEIPTAPDREGVEWDLTWNGIWGRNTSPGDNDGSVEPGVYVYVIEMTIDGGTTTERKEIEAGDITIFR